MEKVRSYVRKNKLNVKLLGRISHDETITHMLSCKVLAFPSVWHEPLSRSLIESSMLGVPIVATRTGGAPDIITDGRLDCLRGLNQTISAKSLSIW